ncbi:hypothetical protein VPHK406_0217 [Vibrio phage K406]
MKFIVDFKVNVDSKYQGSTWVNRNFELEVEEWDVMSSVNEDIDFLIRQDCDNLVVTVEAFQLWYKFGITNIEVKL